MVLAWLGQWLSNIHPWLREFVSRCRIVRLVWLGNLGQSWNYSTMYNFSLLCGDRIYVDLNMWNSDDVS